jgi:predicted ABC-type transport system involved in lysophospholipase L1 biosynthesis ATPase subunit
VGALLYQHRDLAQATDRDRAEYRRAHVGSIFQSCNLIANQPIIFHPEESVADGTRILDSGGRP